MNQTETAHNTNSPRVSTPIQGWLAVIGGTAINLCLGILYGWSVWKSHLVSSAKAGEPMTLLNEGWTYLTDAQGTWAYSICGVLFALSMIPGGKIQDRWGPKVGATLGGLCMAAGCCLAGWMQSFTGLVLGFGVLGGIGMGLGYAASTPAAVKWFGPQRRGLIIGMVVAGFGAAVIYIAPLAEWLITNYGLSGSFWGLGILFSLIVIVAGQFLQPPPDGYLPVGVSPVNNNSGAATTAASVVNYTASQMIRTWQFWGIMLIFFASAQSGLLLIANLKPLALKFPDLEKSAWIVVSFSGVINALGRVGTGFYSDRLGRKMAYLLNAILAIGSLLLLPWIVETQQTSLFFLVVAVGYWQYGGGLALLPAWTADYFGPKNMGLNYGLVFLGWGLAFFVPLWATTMPELQHKVYLNVGLLCLGLIVSQFLKKPTLSTT